MNLQTIIGAKGFIGGRLLSMLQAKGIECYAPAKGDDGIFGRDLGTVFYCAGLTNDYKDRPFDTVEAHAGFLNRLLDKAKFDKLVYLSSTRLYDSATGDVTKENDDLVFNPTNPRHLFDLSKALGENMCLTAGKGRASVARLSSVYDAAPDATGFLPEMLQRLTKEKSFSLDSSSGIVRDYAHIDDVLAGMIAISKHSGSEIFNLACGENVSNQDMVDTINKEGWQLKLQRQSPREARPVCDITKLKALGVKPVSVAAYLQGFLKKVKSS